MSRSSANSRICRRLSRLRLDSGYNSCSVHRPRPPRLHFYNFRRGRCPLPHPLFPIALPQLSQGALSKPSWKEPRRQSARRLPPVGGRSTPTPACPRPRLQPVHRTQIPVHGYHTTTGPPFIRPCKGGLCASPGMSKGPPRSPFLSAFRLLRLDGRQTTPSTRRERRGSSIDRPADPSAEPWERPEG